MGGLMSRNKGKRGEREVIALLQPIVDRVYGEAQFRGAWDGAVPKLQRNSLQSDGGGFDVVGLEWLALEVKYHESFNLNAWWKQTKGQVGEYTRLRTGAREPQVGVLMYRRNNVKWRVRMIGYIPCCDKKVRTVVDIGVDAWLVWAEARLRAELGLV